MSRKLTISSDTCIRSTEVDLDNFKAPYVAEGYAAGYDVGEDVGAQITEWVRNPEWLPIPEIGASEQVSYCLVRVDNTTGFIGTNINQINRLGIIVTGTGTITAEWGDGLTETLASGATTYHNYDFANCGSQTSEGYRQALLKITSTGNITATNFGITPSALIGTTPKMLDIVERLPNLTIITLKIGLNRSALPSRYVERYWLLNTINNVSLSSFITNAINIREVIITATNVTSLAFFGDGNRAIEHYDKCNITTSVAIAANNTFANNSNLKRYPAWATAIKKLSCASHITATVSLRKADLGDVSTVTSISSAFASSGIFELNFTNNFSACTDFTSPFNGAANLYLFNGQTKLTLDCTSMPLTQNFGLFALSANSIKEIEFINKTGFVTGAVNGAFSSSNLEKITFSFTLRPSTSYLNAYLGATKIKSIYLDLTNSTNNGAIIGSNWELQELRIIGMNPATTGSNSISLNNTKLPRAAIVQVFNDIPDRSATTAGTIDLRNNPNIGDLTAGDLLIATSKNYTVQLA